MYVHSETRPVWRISILADFRPMGYKLSCLGSLWSVGKDLLFKSVLGHCGQALLMTENGKH